jgi:hypothetical protein
MRHLGGRNGFQTEGVRALPCTGIFPGAVECMPDDHLLGATWDELAVDGSEGEGLGSAVRHTGEA